MGSTDPSGTNPLRIRRLAPSDRPWVAAMLAERWGGPVIVTRGRLHQADALPGFVAVGADAAGAHPEPVGLVTYRLGEGECEVISLDSLRKRCGAGSALLAAVEEAAREAGAARLWLVTTNDNLYALGFYQRRGYRLAALHAGSLAVARRLKPRLPLMGMDRIPLRDEIELEKRLADTDAD